MTAAELASGLTSRALLQAECEAISAISLSEMAEVSLLNRVDTKYLVPPEELTSLLAQLRRDYKIFAHRGQRIHGYQTLYFDTQEHAMYLRHHNGLATRLKVRKRWYLESELAYLEVKRRTNRLRTIKKRVRISAMENQLFSERPVGVTPRRGSQQFSKEWEWLRENCSYDVSSLVSRIWTHFERITLVDLALQERVTIDHNLRFCDANRATLRDPMSVSSLEGLDWKSTQRQFCVVEVKRGSSRNRSPVMDALRGRHILPSSFSKYCIGTALLQPQIKHNRFKPILRALGGLQL